MKSSFAFVPDTDEFLDEIAKKQKFNLIIIKLLKNVNYISSNDY